MIYLTAAAALFTATLLAPPTAALFIPLPEDTTQSPRCDFTSSVTYSDQWGPLFTENRYTCGFDSTSAPAIRPGQSRAEAEWGPIRFPLPWSHPGGSRGGDPRVAERGTLISEEEEYERAVRNAAQDKHQIVDYGCAFLPDARQLSPGRYSNLFWGLAQMVNQTCLQPGEVAELIDYEKTWTAGWRFTNVNRGKKPICDWYTELSNVAQALHYFCYHTLNGGFGYDAQDTSGGSEILAYGRDKDEERNQWWCLRYSKRGWGENVFDEKCLGV